MTDELSTTSTTDPPNEPESNDPFATPTDEEIKKNGFYYYFLPEQERRFYRAACESDGLKDVIGLMQVKIMEIQCSQPQNWALFFRAISLLDRLIKTHARYFSKDGKASAEKSTGTMAQRFSPAPGFGMNRAMRREMARR